MFPLSWPPQNNSAANRLKIVMVLLLLDCLDVTSPAYSHPHSLILCSKTKKQAIKHRCERLQLWHVEWNLFFRNNIFQHIHLMFLTGQEFESQWVSGGMLRLFGWKKTEENTAHIILIDVNTEQIYRSHSHTRTLTHSHSHALTHRWVHCFTSSSQCISISDQWVQTLWCHFLMVFKHKE